MSRPSWGRRILQAVKAGLEEVFRPPPAELPEPDPQVMARLSPGLRKLVSQVRITRAALEGDIATMKFFPSPRASANRQLHDQTESPGYQAHQAAVRADTALWDLVEIFDSLPPSDHLFLQARGYTSERLRSLIDSRPQAAERYRPSPAPYDDACAALTKLEQAILGPASSGR